MKRDEWKSLIAKQPSGLSFSELARRIGQQPQLTSYWARKLKYNGVDGRKNPKPSKFSKQRKVDADKIDWSEPSNVVLAKRHKMSRQRIWELRQRITKI